MQRRIVALPVMAVVAALTALSVAVLAQDRLKTMPGYEQYQRMVRQIPTALKSGALSAPWTDNGKSIR